MKSLIQSLIDAAHAEGMACSIYDEEADRQPYIERTQAAKAALESVTGEMLTALTNMCHVWQTVCSVNGWTPDHVNQYSEARAAIAKGEQQ